MSRSSAIDHLPQTPEASLVPSSTENRDARINILLVDDEPLNLTVLETVLNNPGYRLVRAESADEALPALVREEFALIILDVQMPGMTGFELAQMVKQLRKTAGVPIIFLTAYYSDFEHVLEGYGSGAVDYLHKPVNATILRSKVAVFATLHRTTRETELANNSLLAEIAERKRVEEQLLHLKHELERRVEERTSELVQANSAMRESQELLRLAQEAGQVGTWSWDLRTGVGLWTRSAWEIFDPHDPTGIADFEKWLSFIHPDDREKAHHTLDHVRHSGHYWDELRVSSGDSPIKWIELVGAVEYENEVPVRMLGAVRDMTQRKEMELELKDAHRRKDEFLATLAHELRNPLAPIRNSLEILKISPPGTENTDQVMRMTERQAHHLVRLVDDLLDVSRVIGGKIELRLETVDMAILIAEATELTQCLLEETGHHLTLNLPAEPLYVNADPVRMTQIIGNLLANAAKYTEPNGHIWLEGERNETQVVLRIRDTRIGISAEMLSRVFELFVQADQSAVHSQGGLGIGLTLVRNLVELHCGDIVARSEGPGRGSEFQIRLPILSADRERPQNRQTPPAQPRRVSHRLLVVDDNKDAAVSLALLLKLKGHDVLLAHDGNSALELAFRFQPRSVFVDLGMPEMNGFEVATRLRTLPGLANVTLAAVTGWGQLEDRRRTAEAGFNHNFVKPAELQELDSMLETLSSE